MKGIKLNNLLSQEDVADMLDDEFQQQVDRIRKGKVIRKGYTESTIRQRRKNKLQSKYVDLTGNNRYSKKNWRFLDDWTVKMKGRYTATIDWTHALSKVLLRIHTKRYGKLFTR